MPKTSRTLYVHGPVVQNLHGSVEQRAEHFSRIPDSVLCDRELSCEARCVYGILAGSTRQGTTASMGTRLIATKLGIHQQTVIKCLGKLAERKHITVYGKDKQRRLYHLHSDIFGQKQKALDAGETVKEDLVSFPRPRLATVRSA